MTTTADVCRLLRPHPLTEAELLAAIAVDASEEAESLLQRAVDAKLMYAPSSWNYNHRLIRSLARLNR